MASRDAATHESMGPPLEPKWIGGALCLDFVNTVTWETPTSLRNERLATAAHLRHWGVGAALLRDLGAGRSDGAASSPAEEARLMRDVREVRVILQKVFQTLAHGRIPKGSEIAALDRWLHWAIERLRLEPPPGNEDPRLRGSEWVWVPRDRPDGVTGLGQLRVRVLAPVLWSAAELLRSRDLAVLRGCANPRCGWLFLDRSRRHNRRWCDMRECGSRAKARRYYERHLRH